MIITININPVAFHIGSMPIRWYGIIIALAVAVVVLWVWRQIARNRSRLHGADPSIAIMAIASGMGLAKLFHVIDNTVVAKFHPELVLTGTVVDYTQRPELIFSGAGLSIYGAIIGATLFFWIYSRVRHHQFWFFADLAAPGIILAQAIGRIGCTINGCCHGLQAPSWLPWAINYPSDGGYFVHPDFVDKALYPTQPYEIIFCLIAFAVLLKLRGRLKFEGALFLVYFIMYSAWRVGIDFLRAGTPFFFGLHEAQVIAIVALAVIIPALALRRRRVKVEN